jgi:hypothetical protein
MNPIRTRSAEVGSPQRSITWKSTPGAEKPVQQVTRRWVMRWRSSPRLSRSIFVVAEKDTRHAEKQLMHIVGRNAGGDAVDVCGRQFAARSIVLTSVRLAKPCRNVAQIWPARGHFQLALAPCQPIYSGFSIGNMSIAVGGRVRIISYLID